MRPPKTACTSGDQDYEYLLVEVQSCDEEETNGLETLVESAETEGIMGVKSDSASTSSLLPVEPGYSKRLSGPGISISSRRERPQGDCCCGPFKCLLFLLAVLSFFLYLCWVFYEDGQPVILRNLNIQYPWSHNETPNRTRIILGWTTFFGRNMTDVSDLNGCPELNCVLSDDRDDLTDADAILLHLRDTKMGDIKELEEKRRPWQRMVFQTAESPSNTFFDLRKIPSNFFNWTLTYRSDSDIFLSYITYSTLNLRVPDDNGPSKSFRFYKDEKNENVTEYLMEVIQNKTKQGVWLASNCHTQSHRESVIKIMRRTLDIDVWGGCGNGTACPRNKHKQCIELIQNDYKFIFAFENSICKDYITEKFWERWLLDVVPVVLKRSIVAEFIEDPEAFIALDDFDHPEDLADYLNTLDKDPEKYLKHLLAKYNTRYTKVNRDPSRNPFCELCRKLTTPEPKWYPSIRVWWMHGGECDSNFVRNQIKKFKRIHPDFPVDIPPR